MQKLARALIEDGSWVLHCADQMKQFFGDDFMLDHDGVVQDTMMELSPAAHQAARVEATAFLGEIMAADEWGFSKRSAMTSEWRAFFDYLIAFAELGNDNVR